MNNQGFVSSDEIRAIFSSAMSAMYQSEVPLYGTLLDLVAQTNEKVMDDAPEVAEQLRWTGKIRRLSLERHGAIRVGTTEELSTIRRLFAVMGMQPVGYYDLSPAGVPVHATAFRAVHESALQISPFRVFTSPSFAPTPSDAPYSTVVQPLTCLRWSERMRVGLE